MTKNSSGRPLVLVTGATGYIGGRLVPRLLEAGWRVRCLVRDPARLQGRDWQESVSVAAGDVLRPETLAPALAGVEAAYYLVHSLSGGGDFHRRDLVAAGNFGTAARAAGVGRIVYLGGLAEASPGLSEHLRSRTQTGDALREAGVPVTEFRAGVIVGSGSLSFEMIRYLTERVPVMVCPSWVYTRTQPIGVREVLEYLTAALVVAESRGRILEIGGADVITYGEMMTIYAEVRGLRRWMVPVPVLTPRLSSYWVNLVTPIPAAIARPLIEGLRSESVVRDPAARELFPGVRPVAYRTAVERALAQLQASDVETAWSDALSTSQGEVAPVALTTQEGMIVERRQRVVAAPPEEVFTSFTGLGGERGWLYMDWAWKLRGFLDRAMGGVGLRRGRRDPDELRAGDALDFWRVEAVEPNRLLRLRAEMKVPGKAWLQFQATPREGGGTLLAQTAFFAPKGLSGWLYWYALYPLHGLIFSGLIDRIGRRAVMLKPGRALTLAGALVAALALAAGAAAGVAREAGVAGLDRPGRPIVPWVPGTLDVHQISTGRGNAALVVMPDGTTLLVDAGSAAVPGADPRPDGSRTPAGWIAHYVGRVLPAGAPRRLDVALVTHFHADHMGRAEDGAPRSKDGQIRLAGITEVAELLPVGRVIDRGWPDYAYPLPATDPALADYRRFLERKVAEGGLAVERIRVGHADQIVPLRDPAAAPGFEIRAVAGNGEVWTGRGSETERRFPDPLIPDPEISWENLSSIALRIRFGRFDFYTGGDLFGIPDPGLPEWVDFETPVARAIGPTDVHVVHMHGSISVENPTFLAALRSRVIVIPSWSATHPSADVLKRTMAPRAYPGPREVFATVLREPTRAALGPRADRLAGLGHIVVRVDAGGDAYRVVVVDDATPALTVRSVHGPYAAE